MNCKVCNRKLKNHTESGMGKVCQKKNRNIGDESAKSKIRVEPLFVKRQPRRSYMVFTSPRQVVVITENETGRFANCPCSTEMCEHREIVAKIDRQRFPEDLAAAAVEPLMISLNERQAEFTQSIERAAKSKLKVYADFEKDTFVVVNEENKHEHRVALKTVKGKVLASCDCGDFKNRNRICKHLSVVLLENMLGIAADLAQKMYQTEAAV